MDDSNVWQQVKVQATAGTLVVLLSAIFGGVFYLAYTVPRRLDEVLSNQTEFKSQLKDLRSTSEDHERRLIRIETAR